MEVAAASRDAEDQPSARVRRVVIVFVLMFCAGCITYVMILNNDTELHQVIARWAFVIIGAIMGIYVVGAVFVSVKGKM